MKIDIINDNEVNIVFMISDKSSEYNLPKLNGNDLLIESKNILRKLSNDDLNKLFLNNKENLKIYIFPIDVDSSFLKSDKIHKCYNLLEDFINNNDVIDIGYIKTNQLDYIFSINEFSKSFKQYLNDTFETLEKQISINGNYLNQKYNDLIVFLKKYEILHDLNLDFPNPNKFEKINLSSNTINTPDEIDKHIILDKNTDIDDSEILLNLNNLNKKYEILKNKIESLHSNFLIKFSCFDAITTEELLINSLMINNKHVDESTFYYIYENGIFQYYLNVTIFRSTTLKILKDDYIEIEVKIDKKFSIDEENIVINLGRLPLIKNKSHAYVLTWGSQPSDLDTHMFVFDENFIQLDHISFQQHSGYNSTVSLDVDDTSSFGPETLTITEFNNDAYYLYTIHNYSDQGNIGRWNYDNLTKINIIENNKLYTIQPHANEYDGSWWDVFVIHNGKIYITNTLISNNNRSSWCDVSFSKEEASNIIKKYIGSSTNIIDVKRN